MPDAHIPHYRFGSHDLITIGAVEYRPRAADKRGHEFRRADDTGVAEFFSHEQIYLLCRKHELIVEKGHFLPSTVEMKKLGREVDLTTLTPQRQLKVLWKEDWCLLFLEEEAEGRTDRTSEQMRATILRLVGVIQERHDDRRRGANVKKAPRSGTEVKG